MADQSFYNKVSNTRHNWIFGEKSMDDCISYIKKGLPIIVVDDDDRENEGDLIMAAEDTTPEMMALYLKLTSGVVCCSITEEKAYALKLERMKSNKRDPNDTAFTTSVDYNINVTTGISAIDRSRTLIALSYDNNYVNYRQPGHIFPLIAKDLGVLKRLGHTEATMDIMKMANKQLCGTLAEITSDNKLTMAKYDELLIISKNYDIPITSIQDIICYKIKFFDNI